MRHIFIWPHPINCSKAPKRPFSIQNSICGALSTNRKGIMQHVNHIRPIGKQDRNMWITLVHSEKKDRNMWITFVHSEWKIATCESHSSYRKRKIATCESHSSNQKTRSQHVNHIRPFGKQNRNIWITLVQSERKIATCESHSSNQKRKISTFHNQIHESIHNTTLNLQ